MTSVLKYWEILQLLYYDLYYYTAFSTADRLSNRARTMTKAARSFLSFFFFRLFLSPTLFGVFTNDLALAC